ncbi:hypothetical protein [Vibrio maerlii]|uniref:hypothetical protein n=1 Tax=Vibrio maerlii TaxID=2231648 RepID=UPI000E3D4BCE|nr:hypothetical protein [Vibrio maerlii]
MIKRTALITLSMLAMSQQVNAACELSFDRSVMLQDEAESSLCLDIVDGLTSFTDNLLSVGGLLDEDVEQDNYWSDWVLSNNEDPFITQQVSQSYFGLGVWIPEELDQDKNLTTEEWLLSHGLQLSVGLGDKNSDTPRVRLDYRWHETHDGDLMMQVEVPF